MFGFHGCVIRFEKVVSFCKHQIVFWLFHLLLWAVCGLFLKSKQWLEKCAKAIEKNCNSLIHPSKNDEGRTTDAANSLQNRTLILTPGSGVISSDDPPCFTFSTNSRLEPTNKISLPPLQNREHKTQQQVKSCDWTSEEASESACIIFL